MGSTLSFEVKKKTRIIDVGNRLALLVGINGYEDLLISDLNFSVKDIKDFYEILVDPEIGKCDKNNIKILTDESDEKPTRNNIISKLKNICRSANPEDSVLFYFSGHGYEKDGKSYLLCSDTYFNSIEETAISTEFIRKTMEDSLARIKIIILDSCHSGVIKGIKDSGRMTEHLFKAFFPPPEGFAVISSCKLGEYSYEWPEKKHSVFSYYLLEGLRGGADKDRDGIVTLTELYQFTSENVKKWAFQNGLEQNPTMDAKISGDIPLTFVEKIPIRKEEPVDKSVIHEIYMTTVETTKVDIAEQVCGLLLEFFKPSEIKQADYGRYEFPYGTIYFHSKYERTHSFYVNIYFKYEKENWVQIDKIINYLTDSLYFTSIEYILNKKIDIEKLVNKCRENDFRIVTYTPEKGKEKIEARTVAWLDTSTLFTNDAKNNKSSVKIRKFGGGPLPKEFYSTLSPENIIEFMKVCLE